MRRAVGLLAGLVSIGIVFWGAQAYLSSGNARESAATSAAPAAPPTAPSPATGAGDAPAASAVASEPAPSSGKPVNAQAAAGAAAEPVPVADAAEKVRPAVAFIAVRQVSSGTFLRAVPQSGVGSGVIYDDAGRIITNNHVVQDAREMSVTLPDGRSFPAKLVGSDRRTDLAVIQIEGEKLPRARLGDSDKLRVGEWVIAIGNALGLEGGPTVTAGVVGALNRSITEPNDETLENLIQTDAAINPGNSGGPLINLSGEVVGINTAIATEAQGIGFAISINAARPIIAALVENGRMVYPFLGVQTADITPALAARYDLPAKEGLLVVTVTRGTPAARAGLQQGDVITAVDNDKVRTTRDFRTQLNRRKPGDAIRLSVLRGRDSLTLAATLTESPR